MHTKSGFFETCDETLNKHIHRFSPRSIEYFEPSAPLHQTSCMPSHGSKTESDLNIRTFCPSMLRRDGKLRNHRDLTFISSRLQNRKTCAS